MKFKISLLLLIFFILGISSITTLISVLSINKNIGIKNAELSFKKTGMLIENKLNEQMSKAIELVRLMKTIPSFTDNVQESGIDYSGLGFMIQALDEDAYLYSIYSGKKNSEFIQVIKSSSNKMILNAHNAPEKTAYILRAISGYGSTRTERWSYLDNKRNIIEKKINPQPEYNPAVRPWFKLSQENPHKVLMTSPYVFHSLKKPGLTVSSKISEDTVIGIDITLAGLKSFISNAFISEGTAMMILDDEDRILVANSVMEKILNIPKKTLISIDDINKDSLNEIMSDKKYLSKEIPWELAAGKNYKLIITAPISDFLTHQQLIQNSIIIISIIIFILVIPIVVFSSSSLSSFLEKLAIDASRIQQFDYSGDLPKPSPVIEFNELADVFRTMKITLSQKTNALETALDKLKRINELGLAMSVEKNCDRLVELVLKGAKEISHSDGGSLYLKNNKNELEFKIVLNDSLGFEQGGISGTAISLPSVPLFNEDGTPNYNNVVSYACHKCSTVVIEDAYKEKDFDFSGTRKFDEMNEYRSKSFLTVPLKLYGGEVIGALQLINCRADGSGDVISFNSDIQSFVETLSAEAAAILYNRNLMEANDNLFESLIQLVAIAIDTKNPYTGGHCERVPDIAMMLAEAAEEVSDGALADFKFKTEEEKRAFRIGSLLHDAGKITTPEFVVNKAVKLETIYNRIHEIRTRFEVLLRDVWIEEKEAIIAGEDPEKVKRKRVKKEKKLIEEYNFIARFNIGETNPEPYWIKRLNKISERTWMSHFDHTIGLSREEKEKIDKSFIPGKPIKEKLLSDKLHHLIPHKKDNKKIYKKYGFILPHPEYLYNRGELYNLTIPYGTLTTEERYKINEHIMQTIVMLDQLPLTNGLEKITDFCGAHHETLTGSGYPRGLTKDDLSIPSRILAIADIFEALTASDRPYKTAKSLSQAISILNDFKEKGLIDSQLFELFLKSGIYNKYAEKYLNNEQIDKVEIEKYINK